MAGNAKKETLEPENVAAVEASETNEEEKQTEESTAASGESAENSEGENNPGISESEAENITAEDDSEEDLAESEEEESADPQNIPEEEISGAKEAKEALSPQEYDEWLTLQRRIHFSNRHRVAKAKKSEKRERYAEENVITEDREDKVTDVQSVHLREDYMELVASANAHGTRLLEGIIDGFRYMDTNSSEVKRVIAAVTFGHGTFDVMIPDYVLFNFRYDDSPSETLVRQVENRIRRMIGTRIKFVCKYVDEKKKIAYGDRLKAMEFVSWQNYDRVTRTGNPRITVGSKVQAQVIAVADNYIIVNAEGSDSKIMKDEVAWEYIPSCKNLYKVNDMVTCKVLSINKGVASKAMKEEYNLVATKLSIKQCTENPVIKFYDLCSEGAIYRATVTGVEEVGVFVNIQDKIPALMAFPTYGVLPKVGDSRAVQINRKEYNEETGTRRFWGMLLPE